MPKRFLKPGLLISKRWNLCSWHGQSFYIRLVMLADDFGRHEAGFLLLRNLTFPLHEDIRTSQVQQLCSELELNRLAIFYKVDGKEYLQLLRWTERVRAIKSYYPGPCGSFSCKHLLSNDNSCAPPRPRSPSPSPSPPTSCAPQVPADDAKERGKGSARGIRLHGIPASVDDVIEFGKTCMPKPVSEDRCRAFWAHYEGQARTNQNGDTFWITSNPSGEIVVTNWKVKLPQFGLKDHETNRRPDKQRPDRNAGTANEGAAGKYERLGKVAKA